MPLAIIMDSDGGVDDAVALWFACMSPDVELVAVTAVAGNVSVDQAATNLATVLAHAGRGDVPVALGAATAIGPTPGISRPAGIHGLDGLGNAGPPPVEWQAAGESAADMLARLVRERPGELTVVSTGPLTNLAHVLRGDPSWAGRVRRLVAMGGSVRAGGNATPLAEANIAHDPSAAAETVAARWSTPPLLVGLDVTHQATLSEDEFVLVREHRSLAAAFCDRPLAFYRPQGSTFTPEGTCPCHDLVAMMAAVDPELVSGPVVPLAVDIGGSAAWGTTVADLRQPFFAARGLDAVPETPARWQVGLTVDVDRFRAGVRWLFGG